MARIVEYQVVYAGSESNIEDKVRPLIEKGWQPFGSLVGVMDSGSLLEAQPMVRYEDPAPTPKPALPPGITLVESILPGTTK